jgi:hypothetical protein
VEILPILGPSIDFRPALPAASPQLQLSSCLVPAVDVIGVTRNSCSCPPKPAGPLTEPRDIVEACIISHLFIQPRHNVNITAQIPPPPPARTKQLYASVFTGISPTLSSA